MVSFFLVLILSLASAASAAPRPNIVLMMADDQGWGETGYNGHPDLKTPTLDQMATTGLRFDRFYAASPLCTPTRASVMTGRHANRSGAFAPNWSTRPEEVTVARILKDAGYRTGHFGKWHLGAVKKESPLNPGRMGFDEYLAHDNFFEMDPPLSRNGEPPEIMKGESSELIVDEAVGFLRKVHAEKKPFFIVVWFGSPHSPYSGLAADVARYAGVKNEEMRKRFAEITAMDRAVGTFRAALRELGEADNTLLWFNSDNGIAVANPKDSFNGGWRGHKGDIYDGGLRVPAVIEWPAVIRAPRVTAVPCVTSDILPTLLDVAGAKHPFPDRPLDGISLRALVADNAMKERPSPVGFWIYPAAGEKKNGRWVDEALARGTTPTTRNPAIDFTNFRHPVAQSAPFGGKAAWLDNRYKLVVISGKQGRATELYDLLDDPRETKDLAPEKPDVVKRMAAQLEAWQRSVENSLTGADYK
jgi:arylsulfatase A-like enzyme